MKRQSRKLTQIVLLGLLTSASITAAPSQTTQSYIDFEKPDAIDFNHLKTTFGITISPGLKKYYANIDRVGGWFDKRLIILLAAIDLYQKNNNITGNIGEIGVLHGKSFIPMTHLIQKNEHALAIDCFEIHEFNRDNSGGDAQQLMDCSKRFIMNNHQHGANITRLKILQGDSLQLKPEDFSEAAENNLGFRLFSIDGCHEADTTDKDMENAFHLMVRGGVIIMDDYFNWGFPGVSEGVNRFMTKYPGKLKPFFIGWNKIFFAQPEHVDAYFNAIKSLIRPNDITFKKFFDVTTLIYDPKPW